MQAHVFAEESNTTADNRDQPIGKYYGGLFSTIAGLYDDLSALTDVDLHVLSGEYGVAGGRETASTVFDAEQTPIGRDEMVKRAKTELVDAAGDADVMVVLLSTDVFQLTVGDVWDELVSAAKPESIWCLGAARSSLEELDLGGLEEKGCLVLTYERVGVARIGTDTREELIETVTQQSTR